MGQERLALVGLLEVKLAEGKRVTLLERAEIDKVIREQQLQLLFSPEGTGKRVAVGRLLKADLLVFLRERKRAEKALDGQQDEQQEKERKRGCDLTVAETAHGLRLVMSTAIWDPSQVEATAAGFVERVKRACDLAAASELKVFAVPAFESKDIMPEYTSQRRGFARLVEDFLLSTPGVVVAELSEAEALSRESTIGGTTIVRDLPYYLIGSYKSSRANGKVGFEVAIDFRQGREAVGRVVRSGIGEDRLGEAIKDAVSELLSKIGGAHQSAKPKAEVRVLLDRADVFRSLVEWDEALPLYESALLLDPHREKTHLRLLEGYLYMARSGGKRLVKWPYYDPVGRLHYGELAFVHASALLRQGRLSQELLRTLSQLTVSFYVSEYQDDTRYRGIRDEMRRIVIPLGDEVLAFLSDPQWMARVDKSDRQRVLDRLGKVVHWANGHAVLNECLKRNGELLALLDSLDVSFDTLVDLMDESHGALLDQLEKHPSRRIQQAAHLCQLANHVRSQEELEQVRERAGHYVAAEGLDPRLVSTITRMAREKYTLKAKYFPDQVTSAPAEDKNVFLPRLTVLNDQWTSTTADGRRVTPFVHDWLTCGPGSEIILVGTRLYRLVDGARLELLVSVGQAAPSHWMQSALNWDGKYIWVTTSRPREALVVVDPVRGEIARFDENEVVQGSQVVMGQLACIRPGQALFFGCLKKPPDPLRTWAVLLEVEAEDGKPARKHFERIYEERERQIGGASSPCWAITIPTEVEPSGPWVMVKTSGKPLIFDIPRKQVRLAKVDWPLDCPLYLNRDFVVPGGGMSMFKQESHLGWTDHPDDPVRRMVDWGERPMQAGVGDHGFFTSGVMYKGWLHLLARYDGECSPVWIAVDPKTWETRILIDKFPKDWPRRYSENLRVSDHFGLLYISAGRAYRAELPPAEMWPKMDAKVMRTTTRPVK